MRQVLLSRASALLRRPAVLTVAGLLALGGSALVFLPLFGLPGFELSLALSIAVGTLGGGVGIAAAAQERRLLKGEEPRLKELPRPERPTQAVAQALGTALLLNTAVLVPPFLSSTLFALFSTECDPFELVGFYPLLTLPSAALASAAGVFCGFWARTPGRGVLAYVGLVLLSGLHTAWPIVFGPQVYAFNHFLGHLPGPLYDEALAITPRLGWFRLETLALAGLLALLTAISLDVRAGRLSQPNPSPGAWLLLTLGVGTVAILEGNGPTLGLRMTHEYLSHELGGLRDSQHFRLHYARGMDRDAVERTVRDLEFRHQQLSTFLGGSLSERIHVYLYRTEEEKQALVGAGRTQFAKPWLAELHINDRPFPHSTLHHELAHVMAASAGSGPFRVTTRFGLWPLMGVIEGFAVAADAPVQGELTLHEWAAGMRRQKLAPDMRKLMGTEGFYQSAPARAYTVAGSFLRYLADTYGSEKVRVLYAHADFQLAYGRSLDDLVTEWERYLDTLPLDEGAISRAFLRFRTGSLFTRTCAREVARLQQTAQEALATDPQEALELYRRAAELQPEEPTYVMGQSLALDQLDRTTEAVQLLAPLAEKVKEQPAMLAEVVMDQADLALRLQQLDVARQYLERVLTLAPSPELTRSAQIKLASLDSPSRLRTVESFFRLRQEEVRLLYLARALQAAPRDPYFNYLLGRRLHQAGDPRLAVEYLTQGLASGGLELSEAIRREALRLLVESSYLAGDCGAVRHEVGALPDFGPAFKAVAVEWVARCDFEDAVFQGPLVPRQAFR
ncbi:tetratricopeptide repeat protein [Hyalangium gracile]|uniref:tetratricopeptide repeat protein n=1 Tax=Hyalangium gracile TaxID=394092 RepID=UPI001CC95933|nr:tetratricopeptide repeat protein [Hyalangium gracile]